MCFHGNKDSSNILHGFYSGLDREKILYGYIDLDNSKFEQINSFPIAEFGDPSKSFFPLTYDPLDDLIYLGSINNQNETILNVLDANTGQQLMKFNRINGRIISLQYDCFRQKLFSHIQFNVNQSAIVQINPSNGTIQQILFDFPTNQLTPIASYSSVSGEYFVIFIENNHWIYQSVDINNPKKFIRKKLNFVPLNMKYDSIQSQMFMVYQDQPDEFINSIGIFNEQTGEISKYIGTITWSSSLIVHSQSTYDTAKNIYYLASEIKGENYTGITTIDIETSQIQWKEIPLNITRSLAFFLRKCFPF